MLDAPVRTALARLIGGDLGPDLSDALERLGLATLARLDADELARECRLTPARATRVAAAFSLGRAAERARLGARPRIQRPADVARLLAPEMRGLEVETFHVLVLDARHRLKARRLVSRGILTHAPVHPREVFAPALRLAGAAVVVAHNHPSGDPAPSREDRAVTQRLIDAGQIVAVPLLDHVIVAGERWASLREDDEWAHTPGWGSGWTERAESTGARQ